MRNIDLSRLITTEAKAAAAVAAAGFAAKAECRARIFAVVDEIAQINLAAAAAADRLNPVDLATYRAGLDWIQAMRVAYLTQEPGADVNWPPVPEGMAELAAQF
ncbi:hypothetical protein [Falsiphaeobacter marinintestinus]|uniref:hypothetical protein n=1 Tax=Falsiphaeobacter marinintestinus TaxID=1492905 RepID=UPI0011B3BB95|nr:hypothetical protein [Phaeobacter marinintestinus]